MQIAGSHRMTSLVRHNDDSVGGRYIKKQAKKHLRRLVERFRSDSSQCECTQLQGSEELRIIQSVISRLWQRFQDDGNVSRRYSTGRSQVTMPNEDQYLAVNAKRSRQSTASDMSR
ncbi:transposable element Tcb1 transposase [Trichonephila clavipes]|nr:transposable element Tcb1 transposase [Trichonephila clavipes]